MPPGRDRSSLTKGFRKAGLVLVFAAGMTAVLLGLNFAVYHELQARLKIRVKGEYRPAIFLPSFEVKHGSFVWRDRVQMVDGDFKVTFDPLTLVSRSGIRIIFESTGCKVKLLGNWSLQQGVADAVVDSLFADVILGRRGLTAINEVEAKSSVFQFSLKDADKSTASKT